MGLRLHVVSRHRQSLGERGVKDFGQNGGTIGRSLESDWVLPDGQRFLSSRHASIDYRSGSYYIIDTSTNGVFVNGAERPVGRGNPQRLFSGDRLRLGDYEIVAEIDDDESSRVQFDPQHIDPVDLRQRVDPPDAATYDLVDAYEITGVGIETLLDEDEAETLSPLSYKFQTDELTLEEDDPEPKPEKAKVKLKTRAPKAAREKARATRPAAKSSRRKETRGTDTDALAAFFHGAGLEVPTADAAERRRIMRRLGQVLREMTAGVTESSKIREAQRTALRQSDDPSEPPRDNAFKQAANAEEALRSLLETQQHANPVDAAREAFRDFNIHQQVLLKAYQIALQNFLDQLDPDVLEDKFSNGKRSSFMAAASKLKYWDLYRDLYLVLRQPTEGELPEALLEELARAYEKEAARAEGAAERRELRQKAG